MTQFLSKVPGYNELLKLNDEQLIKSIPNLVDNASMVSLSNCFENIFRESIIKYLLKHIITNEISNLSINDDNWKRVSLIKRIAELNPNYPPKVDEAEYNSSDSEEEVGIIETMNNVNNINDEIAITSDKLLISGYIKHETDVNINNETIPYDILAICQNFIGDISNITNEHQIIGVSEYQFCSIFGDKSTEYEIEPIENINDIKNDENNCCYIDIHNDTDIYKINSQYLSKSFLSSSKFISIYKNKLIFAKNNNSEIYLYDTDIPNRYPNEGFMKFYDEPRLRLLCFPGISGYANNHSAKQNIYQLKMIGCDDDIPQWKYCGNLIQKRGFASLCNFDEKVAIIGGETYHRISRKLNEYQSRSHSNQNMLKCVEIYDLENKNNNKLIKDLNFARKCSGCYYNKYSKEIIVFGGTNILSKFGEIRSGEIRKDVARSMEIYDIHKNIWNEIPYLTVLSYCEYPCVWTVGSKCIFVAKINKNQRKMVQCEWIDLRVCNKNGENKSRFNKINDIHTSQFGMESELDLIFRNTI